LAAASPSLEPSALDLPSGLDVPASGVEFEPLLSSVQPLQALRERLKAKTKEQYVDNLIANLGRIEQSKRFLAGFESGNICYY
jgi:hypothetical protein